ncbi:MAG: hypothetical protein WDA72_06960 [Desulfomonilia bacterium]|jgi:hypothetical protein|nr:hypothetical protein [Deltaproteobacteria bacterium]MDX9760648.1 hypothetical protein [Desulfomonilia bacterium]
MADTPLNHHAPEAGAGSFVNPGASPQEEVTAADEENTVLGSAMRVVMRRDGTIHRASYVLKKPGNPIGQGKNLGKRS